MIDILRIYYNSHAFVNGCCESWNETDEGGSMHVRRMAKDLSDENVFNFTSTLLARVVSSSLPLFISSHSFLLPSLISSSLFIYVHLARDSLLFSSLTLAMLAILPALQKKKTLCQVSLRSLSLFFFSPCRSFLPLFRILLPPPSLFIPFHNERHYGWFWNICSNDLQQRVRTRSWNVSALIKGTASLQLPELTSFANTSVFSRMSFFLSSFFSFFLLSFFLSLFLSLPSLFSFFSRTRIIKILLYFAKSRRSLLRFSRKVVPIR